MLAAFLSGFFTALIVVLGTVAWGLSRVEPCLAARVKALQDERRGTLAKAVKAAASVDQFKISTIGRREMTLALPWSVSHGARFE